MAVVYRDTSLLDDVNTNSALSGHSSTSASQANYTRLSKVVNLNTQKILGNVEKMNDLLQQLQSLPVINSELWSKLQHIQRLTSQLAKNTANHLKSVKQIMSKSLPGEQTQEKRETEQLGMVFENALGKFKRSQGEAALFEKTLISRARNTSGSKDAPHPAAEPLTRDHQEQQQLLLNQDNLEEIQQREKDLLQLEDDILAVNEIFKDLASIVEEQGETIDRIADNVDQAEVLVEDGKKELADASVKKKGLRKKKLICGVVIVVFVIILILIIYFSIPKS